MEDFKTVFNYEVVDPAKDIYVVHMRYGRQGIPIDYAYVHDCNVRDFIVTSDIHHARRFNDVEDAKEFILNMKKICQIVRDDDPKVCEVCDFLSQFEIVGVKYSPNIKERW